MELVFKTRSTKYVRVFKTYKESPLVLHDNKLADCCGFHFLFQTEVESDALHKVGTESRRIQ